MQGRHAICVGLTTLLIWAAASATAQQPTMQQMAAKISALEADLRQELSRLQDLESKVGNQDLVPSSSGSWTRCGTS